MKDLVTYIATHLVEKPEDVQVRTRRSGSNLYIDLTAASADVGRLIGRRGRTAEAIRTVARVAAARQGLRVSIDID